jgi:signal transduction histidine kinase
MTVRPFGSGADRRLDLPSAYASNGGTRIRHAPRNFLPDAARVDVDSALTRQFSQSLFGIALLAAMFVAIVWHANRRIAADRERQLIGEKNSRLLEAQRRFLQDASHHLRTPITIALTHAELLARDLDGRELRDIATVLGEITRLRRLSERLLVIAAAEDPDFLRTERVMLDEFAIELIGRWRPTASREWKLGRLDAATVLADTERLGLAMDALLENAIRHTRDGDLVQLSVTGGNGLVRIAVSDTGGGIGAGELGHVFDRFRTGTNANGTRGTGLGLALVRAAAP